MAALYVATSAGNSAKSADANGQADPADHFAIWQTPNLLVTEVSRHFRGYKTDKRSLDIKSYAFKSK